MALEILSRLPASPSDKPPILFVHGAWHGAWCWDEHFLSYFAERGYRAYAPSFRAHGGNDRAGIRWKRIDDYVEDLAAAVASLDRPPVLVGHSMGGLVVQRYLERGPAPAAVLLASVPPRGVFSVMLRLAARHPWIFLVVIATWSLYPLVRTPALARESFFSADMPEGEVGRLWGKLQEEAYLAFLDMLLLRFPRAALASRGGTPMLVLGAADDAIFTPAEVRQTAAGYATTAEIFPAMAHDMMLEKDWRAVADRVLAWLGAQGM